MRCSVFSAVEKHDDSLMDVTIVCAKGTWCAIIASKKVIGSHRVPIDGVNIIQRYVDVFIIYDVSVLFAN